MQFKSLPSFSALPSMDQLWLLFIKSVHFLLQCPSMVTLVVTTKLVFCICICICICILYFSFVFVFCLLYFVFSSNQCTFCCNALPWSHYWTPHQNLYRFLSSLISNIQTTSQFYSMPKLSRGNNFSINENMLPGNGHAILVIQKICLDMPQFSLPKKLQFCLGWS